MNKIEKLFRRISKKERLLLIGLIENFHNIPKGLDIKKLKDSDFYRVRKGKFRIIFHYDDSKNLIIDSIKSKGGATYRNL